jgi:glycosyltransferase involved in cell wall biosynthesis
MPYEVTIGIPVYNVERYIRQTLDSVMAQTFQNIEFLICDDCGTDSSIDIVREYQHTHPRGKDIRIVRQPRNMGLGNGRNRMIAEACGRYIYFMDADDILSPDSIQLLMEQAIRYDADMVYGSMEKILLYDNNRHEKNANYFYMYFSKEDEFASWAYRKYDGLQASTCNFLIKVDIFKNNDIRYKPINYWEDFTTTIDIPTYVTRVVMIPNVTYYYICREGSMSNYQHRSHIDKTEIQQTINAMALVKQSVDRVKEKPYFHKYIFKVMMTHFYMVCAILKSKKAVSPSFTRRELRDIMSSPLSFTETISLKGWKCKNLALFMLGILPSTISILIIKMSGKIKGLI